MRQVLALTVAVVLCCADRRAAEASWLDTGPQSQTAYGKARALYEAGRYSDAIAQGELALREAVRGGGKRELAQRLDLLGVLYGAQGDYARAEPLLQRGLEIREAVLGKDAPEVAQT